MNSKNIQSIEPEECYICFEPEDKTQYIYTFVKTDICKCKGSLRIHKSCYDKVLEHTNICGICKTKYKIDYIFVNGLAEVIERTPFYRTVYSIDKKLQKQGIHRTYYENVNIINNTRVNQLYIEKTYLNNKLHGKYKEFYKTNINNYNTNLLPSTTGSLYLEANFKEDKLHGICKYYYKQKYPYEYNKLKLCEELIYTEGVLNGICQEFHENGKVACVKTYKNDIFHGKYTEYNENGNIINDGNYVVGEKKGVWKSYTYY